MSMIEDGEAAAFDEVAAEDVNKHCGHPTFNSALWRWDHLQMSGVLLECLAETAFLERA